MMATADRLMAAVRAYAHHPDPRVAAGNMVALVVASNQPFYPAYLYWLVSERIDAAWFTFLSTPLFLAVPLASRRDTRLGRALLPLAGIANTVLCAQLFGVRSGVEMFLVPCAVLALLLFRPAERLVAFAIVGLAFAAYMGLGGVYGDPLHLYSDDEYLALARLNMLSAATLTLFAALIFSGLLADAERAVLAEPAGGEETGG